MATFLKQKWLVPKQDKEHNTQQCRAYTPTHHPFVSNKTRTLHIHCCLQVRVELIFSTTRTHTPTWFAAHLPHTCLPMPVAWASLGACWTASTFLVLLSQVSCASCSLLVPAYPLLHAAMYSVPSFYTFALSGWSYPGGDRTLTWCQFL